MERKYPLISRHIGHFPKVNLAENIESFDNLIPGSIVNAVAIVSSIYIHDRKVQVGNQCPETTVCKYPFKFFCKKHGNSALAQSSGSLKVKSCNKGEGVHSL